MVNGIPATAASLYNPRKGSIYLIDGESLVQHTCNPGFWISLFVDLQAWVCLCCVFRQDSFEVLGG